MRRRRDGAALQHKERFRTFGNMEFTEILLRQSTGLAWAGLGWAGLGWAGDATLLELATLNHSAQISALLMNSVNKYPTISLFSELNLMTTMM